MRNAGSETTGVGRVTRRTERAMLGAFCSMAFAALMSAGCATTTVELPPSPPKYVYQNESVDHPAVNSLWSNGASLYEDPRARRLNDLVTIQVVENITGSGTADTNTSKKSTLDVGVSKFFGTPLDLNLKNLYGHGNTFTPGVAGSATNDFQGSGATSRVGSLVGTITAKIVEVMPNNNLVLEARKELTINNEKQILVLRGMIRPDDIAVDNTILSSRVADAKVYFVGDGVVQDKQRPGWLVRGLDAVWPF